MPRPNSCPSLQTRNVHIQVAEFQGLPAKGEKCLGNLDLDPCCPKSEPQALIQASPTTKRFQLTGIFPGQIPGSSIARPAHAPRWILLFPDLQHVDRVVDMPLLDLVI